MERRGSGIKKIIAEYKDQHYYTDEMCPVFVSEYEAFFLTLKNLNYNQTTNTTQVTAQVAAQVELDDLVEFCSTPKSRKEMMAYMKLVNRHHFADHYLKPLLKSDRLAMTIPEKPNSSKQKYIKKS